MVKARNFIILYVHWFALTCISIGLQIVHLCGRGPSHMTSKFWEISNILKMVQHRNIVTNGVDLTGLFGGDIKEDWESG